jgi:predicted nucleic acid-binding protein
MTERRLLDTNLIVRFLVGDHEKHARAAAKLFEAADRNERTLIVLPAVLAECVFVLESFYKRSRSDIGRALVTLLSSPGVEIPEMEIHLDALERYAVNNLHFVDCTLAAYAASKKLALATFDSDFRIFEDVKIKLD